MLGMRVAAAIVLTAATLTGCSSGSSDEPTAPETFSASGRLHIDAVAAVRIQDDGTCQGVDELSKYREGAEVVTITDPNGRKVALGKFSAGKPQIVTDKGEQYYVPGVCTFRFTIPNIPKDSGVFTAAIGGVEKSFTADSPTGLNFTIDY